MNKNRKGSTRTKKVIPFTTAEGLSAFVSPDTIPQEKWNHHHGQTASGQKVNSLQTTTIGDSLLIRTGKGGPTLSVTHDEFEVAAVQILGEMGYKLTPPAGH